MRFTRVLVGGRPAWGRVEDDVVHLLHASPLEEPRPTATGTVPLAAVRYLPPVVPNVFYAVGLNYADHVRHAAAHGYAAATAVPARPEVGYRANNALVGHGEPIVKPSDVRGRFEAEGELVAVIGKPLRRASYAQAQDAIFGWTIGNDVSAREWQHADRTFWRSKNSDTFKPMGPWIDTEVDALAQTTTVRLDGEVTASFRTGAMVFDPFEYIVEATRYLTMSPGDVLWLGADGTCQLEPGSVVDIEISGIGVLSNPVHAEHDEKEVRP
jgi:2-keto-4-pentenoate hydratase/2-oxohepta-3-ene-1,7-dioic acid hydratase in catechol pathway